MELTNLNNGRSNRRKPKFDLQDIVYGKIPPQAKELEETVLGACYLPESKIFYDVAEILKPECFYVDSHQRIFKAMLSLLQKSEPIDLLTLVEELKKREDLENIGGPYALTKMQEKVVTTSHTLHHCEIIKQKFLSREVIRIAGEAIGDAYEDSIDPKKLLNQVSNSLYMLQAGTFKKDLESSENLVFQTISDLTQKVDNQGEGLTGIDTSFSELNNITGGWQAKDLVILAARPSVGKTAMAIKLMKTAALAGVGAAFFSLEMPSVQIINRLLSEHTEISFEDIVRGRVTKEQKELLLNKHRVEISKLPFWVDDTPGLNVIEFKSKVRRLKSKNPHLKIILIDYLQLMQDFEHNPGESRNDILGKISRQLKEIAKEYEVTIIALSQLSREVENRPNPEPKLSDLRDSGAIEQDADIVLFLYRKDGVTHVRVGKNRNGKTETFRIKTELNIMRFSDYGSSEIKLTEPIAKPFDPSKFVKKGTKFKSEESNDFDSGFTGEGQEDFNFNK